MRYVNIKNLMEKRGSYERTAEYLEWEESGHRGSTHVINGKVDFAVRALRTSIIRHKERDRSSFQMEGQDKDTDVSLTNHLTSAWTCNCLVSSRKSRG